MTDKHVGAVIVHQHDLVIRLRIIFPQNVYQHVVDVQVAVVGAEDEESNIKRKTLIYIYQFIPATSNICFTRERKVLSFRIISCAALALRSRSCSFAGSSAQRICSIISSSL